MLANAGDARAVLYDQHGNVRLRVCVVALVCLIIDSQVRATTDDHKPQSAREAARIRAVDGGARAFFSRCACACVRV